jgi:F-type H+-transporting ATPase subunit b
MPALTLALATPAVAAEQGMPQLNFSTYPSQLFWLAVFFFALYMVISRVALPRIGGVLEERRTRIASDLDRAQELKDDTERAIATYESELAEARSRAHGIVQQRREEMTAELNGERAELEKELAAKVSKAEQAITTTRDKALGQVERMAADVAGDIVARLAGIKVSKAEVARAVSRAGGK